MKMEAEVRVMQQSPRTPKITSKPPGARGEARTFSLPGRRRSQPFRHFDLRFPASSTVRQYVSAGSASCWWYSGRVALADIHWPWGGARQQIQACSTVPASGCKAKACHQPAARQEGQRPQQHIQEHISGCFRGTPGNEERPCWMN